MIHPFPNLNTPIPLPREQAERELVVRLHCLWCGEETSPFLARQLRGLPGRVPCPRCGGRLMAERVLDRPTDLGLIVVVARQPSPPPVASRRCIGCGAAVQRAERCRRCYLRHRYATNPEVRSKQLALQAEWRRRQSALAKGRRHG